MRSEKTVQDKVAEKKFQQELLDTAIEGMRASLEPARAERAAAACIEEKAALQVEMDILDWVLYTRPKSEEE